MRLLHTSTFELREFFDNDIPKYAILSHRWENEEVTFRDLQGGLGKSLRGWSKIEQCCAQARSDNFDFVWIDTCCIDKSSSAELSEAINSMYRWYQKSAICYAYLSDVSSKNKASDALERDFAASKWFTRGWTLQELLAPEMVVFFDHEWLSLGTSRRNGSGSLQNDILAVTHIKPEDFRLPRRASVAKRMSWVSKRETTRREDMAYCLMGLFDVNMPLLYGEGGKAFLRLQHQILQESDDESIFAWQKPQNYRSTGLLAPSPAYFAEFSNVTQLEYIPRTPYSMTNKGLHIDLEVYELTNPAKEPGRLKTFWAAPLNCARGDSIPLVIYLIDVDGERSRIGPVINLPRQHLSFVKKRQEFYVRQGYIGHHLHGLLGAGFDWDKVWGEVPEQASNSSSTLGGKATGAISGTRFIMTHQRDEASSCVPLRPHGAAETTDTPWPVTARTSHRNVHNLLPTRALPKQI